MFRRVFQIRNWRWQFSLRMLLLLTFAVGLGLTIFRWPWEIRGGASGAPDRRVVERTTTFRRVWDGSPVKHGPERWFDRERRCLVELHYVDGVKVRKVEFDLAGKVTSETRFFPERDEAVTTRLDVHGGESIVYERRESLRTQDYSKEWSTPAGQRLEYLKFSGTHVTEWNGRPIDDAMQQLLAEVNESVARDGWLAPPRVLERGELEELGDNTYRRFFVDSRFTVLGLTEAYRAEVVIHFAKSAPDFEHDWSHRHLLTFNAFSHEFADANIPFLNRFLYEAQCRSQAFTLRPRFGVVCVVPITQRELQAGDPTGATLVAFEPGSPQEADWQQPIVGVPTDIRDHRKRIEKMFAGTSITIDSSRVTGENQEYSPLAKYVPMTYRRPRRDVFGLFLSFNDYRVEQQGNTLIVVPNRATSIPPPPENRFSSQWQPDRSNFGRRFGR